MAVAVLLAVVLFLLLKDDDAYIEEGLIIVHEINPDSVQQISIDNNGIKEALIKKNGVWYTDDGAKEADRLAVDSALTLLCYLYAADVVSEGGAQSLDSFGLDPPQFSIELILTDDTTARILFGVFTSDQRYTYFMTYGSDKVYLLSMVNFDQIKSGLTSLVDLSLDIIPTKLAEIEFSRENGTLVKLIRISEEERIGNEQWSLLEPFAAVANVRLAALVEVLLTPPRLASYVGPDVKPEHGIGSGGMFKVVDSEGGLAEFQVGARAEDGSYYCTVSGKQGVYYLYASYEELFKIDLNNCIQNNILPLDPNTIRSFVLELDGQVLQFDKTAGSLNGEQITDDQTEALFKQITAVTFDGLTDGSPEGNESGYLMIDSEKVVSFSAYKDDYYAVSSFGGDSAVYVRKEKLVELML